MSDFGRHSRVNKFEKRRKNTKSISILLVIGGILIIILLGIWIFGGSNNESEEAEPPTEQQNDNGQANTNESEGEEYEGETDEDVTDNEDRVDNEQDDQGSDIDETNDVSIPSDDVDTEEIEDLNDDNVVKAYTGDWQPIGTAQSEPHEVKYDKSSQDWKEMEDAVKYATGLTNMTTYWMGNDGEQKTAATVSDPDKATIYRVHIAWQTNEGWQPTKVEILKEVNVD